MYYRDNSININLIMQRPPDAVAYIKGGTEHPSIKGKVRFYQTLNGVLTVGEISGLHIIDGKCKNDIFAFHIHSGGECSGNEEDEFADAGTHYNPNSCPHPYHAGDMPPLFSAGTRAFLAFITDRFTVDEIVGKTVMIHEKHDDFTTQPAGNAGKKIACGKIVYL